MFKHICQDIYYLYNTIYILSDNDVHILKACQKSFQNIYVNLLVYTNSSIYIVNILKNVFQNKWLLNYFQIVKLDRQMYASFSDRS